MRPWTALGAAVIAAFSMAGPAPSAIQTPMLRTVDEKVLREYTGVYQWGPNAFVYLQMWNEFTGFAKPSQLVAFDESGDIRTLYPTDPRQVLRRPRRGDSGVDRIPRRVSARQQGEDQVTHMARTACAPRTARRVDTEKHEDVRFANGDVQLAGTLISPSDAWKAPRDHPRPWFRCRNREYVLPFARFLIRQGMTVLAYDKRGVGGSTGDWNTASFDDLAADVVAAFQYLKSRNDIDPAQIGLLGVSQAGWVMPLAAVRAKDLAFLISISGAGVSPAETTIDQTGNEMTARGMKPQTIADIVAIMKLQYQFARTGQGWDEYAAAREKLAARIGAAPESWPATRIIRRGR